MSNIYSLNVLIDYFNNIEFNKSLRFDLKTNKYTFHDELYIFFKSKYIKETYKYKCSIDINNTLNYNFLIMFYLKSMDEFIILDIQSKSKRCFIFDSELPSKIWKKYIKY